MIIELRDIHKSFGGVEVLSGVDLTANGGEVVALVGENGAGKSTLARIISGAHSPENGTIAIDGQVAELKQPQDAMAFGIRVIYQEFLHNIFPQLTVAENLFTLDERGRFGRMFVNKRKMMREARTVMATIGLDVSPNTLANNLTVAELQMLEIVKAMGHNIRMLILDEPTASLDDQESARLFEQIESLRRAGICIIYISHRLEEVFKISDRIVVLRNGQVALDERTANLTERDVVSAMVGRTIEDFYPKEHHSTDEIVLSIRHGSYQNRFSNVNLEVRAGEVLGIGGVFGCGKGDVLRSLFGITPLDRGQVLLGGEVVSVKSPGQAIALGIAYITPDRQSEGLCLQQSVSDNISLASLVDFSPGGIMRRKPERKSTDSVITELQIRSTSGDIEVGRLSGGNQQKILFGRWVMTKPRVLLMEEPTRGVDIGAKAEIYRIINEQAAAGVAIILVSSDLPELIAMSDRLAVMRGGKIVAELRGPDLNQQKLLEYALESAA